jgi:hypothetical protein
MFSVKPQTVYVRGGLKLEFKARRGGTGNYRLGVTDATGTRLEVVFNGAGEVLRVDTLTFEGPEPTS